MELIAQFFATVFFDERAEHRRNWSCIGDLMEEITPLHMRCLLRYLALVAVT